ncbi:MAG: hypothetical protein ACYSWS_11295 [Planctomycetota bacterium]|jgi:hypothetical protein
MQFFILVLPLVFQSNECLADLNDLINYADKHGNSQPTMLTSSKPVDEENESTDLSEELAIPENLDYQLFIGLCCGKCGGNMPLNIPGAGTPEPHEFRIKVSLSYGRMIGLRRDK